MLSIGEFSEMCHLSPQTLRFYHSEGLLVPADVNERTGYRSYTFEQVEQAMLITVLRGTGMSVKLVRRALDKTDAAPALLQQHSAEVQHQRQAQDEAISDAREFFNSWPEARLRHVPEMTVVSKLVPGPSAGGDQYDWDEADAVVTATVQDVVKTVESCGAVVSGTPWRTWASETPEQKMQGITAEGPHWLVKIPVTADEKAIAALSGDVEVQIFEARDELSIFIPGKSSMAKFGTAFSRLVMHPLDAAYIDISHMRQLLHDDGVETTAAICKLDETDLVG
ncbi:MerR family transcriptional regulator [Streptomyces malaysiensis]|uniref:MerR family transcriptional regulator n=1 Tax=Streptomyces malaysiensis subsp. samsunensis TaxID=459658 RepID=A0A9X2LYL2_STRMQ|nr:MerR family transcriptional regulator [Streptomyces samsunensis]MCQ8832057.1 MerR family transcriptional regulator [Streptomyces samsunensis]